MQQQPKQQQTTHNRSSTLMVIWSKSTPRTTKVFQSSPGIKSTVASDPASREACARGKTEVLRMMEIASRACCSKPGKSLCNASAPGSELLTKLELMDSRPETACVWFWLCCSSYFALAIGTKGHQCSPTDLGRRGPGGANAHPLIRAATKNNSWLTRLPSGAEQEPTAKVTHSRRGELIQHT
jgi:hypothetical protein